MPNRYDCLRCGRDLNYHIEVRTGQPDEPVPGDLLVCAVCKTGMLISLDGSLKEITKDHRLYEHVAAALSGLIN